MSGIQTISAHGANMLMAKVSGIGLAAGTAAGIAPAWYGLHGSPDRERLARAQRALVGTALGGTAALAAGYAGSFALPRIEARFGVDAAERIGAFKYLAPRAHLGFGVMLAGGAALVVASMASIGISTRSLAT